MSVVPTLRNLRIVSVLKFKEHERATFFSPSENRCLLASNVKPEQREFVVDSCASMHVISTKDLSDPEMDTLTKSCSPTMVITATGEVQTHEEATGYVKELDIFLKMKVFEEQLSHMTQSRFFLPHLHMQVCQNFRRRSRNQHSHQHLFL